MRNHVHGSSVLARPRWQRTALIAALSMALGACAVTPEPFAEGDNANRSADLLARTTADQEPVSFVPAPDFNGTVSFDYEVSDASGATSSATATVAVTPVADAVADTLTTPEDTPLTFNVFSGTNGATAGSFEDPAAAITGITQPPPGQGTVSFTADGTLTFTPAPGFSGPTSFTYTVTAGGVTETATVIIDVTAAPVANAPNDVAPFPDWPQVFAPREAPANSPVIEATPYAPTPAAEPGPVQQAVDAIGDQRGGMQLGGPPVVLDAVNNLEPLGSLIDGRAMDDPWLTSGTLRYSMLRGPGALDAMPTIISSLRLSDGAWMEMQVERTRVWIDLVDDGTRAPMTDVRIALPGGGSAPPWIRIEGNGHINIDRPPGVQRLALRIVVRRADGTSSSTAVEVDFETSVMRVLGPGGEGASPADAGARRDVRGDARPVPAPPSFSAQLGSASRVQHRFDEGLMDALAEAAPVQ